jgi:hypothetical protein
LSGPLDQGQQDESHQDEEQDQGAQEEQSLSSRGGKKEKSVKAQAENGRGQGGADQKPKAKGDLDPFVMGTQFAQAVDNLVIGPLWGDFLICGRHG